MTKKPLKFPQTSCSQCGEDFGPGDSGYSHCRDHRHLQPIDARPVPPWSILDRTHPWVPAEDTNIKATFERVRAHAQWRKP
jgi:hypothetical protein